MRGRFVTFIQSFMHIISCISGRLFPRARLLYTLKDKQYLFQKPVKVPDILMVVLYPNSLAFQLCKSKKLAFDT